MYKTVVTLFNTVQVMKSRVQSSRTYYFTLRFTVLHRDPLHVLSPYMIKYGLSENTHLHLLSK